MIAVALSGNSSCKTCDFLYFTGSGSNGKSQICRMLRACLTSVYYKNLTNDAFSSDREAQILLNDLPKCARFMFVDDPPKKPLPTSIIKTICDGTIDCRVLHKNGVRTVKVNAKLLFTSNHPLEFVNDDGGIRRRIKSYHCPNTFTDNDAVVSNAGGVGVFKKDYLDFEALTNIEKTNFFYILLC